MEKKTEEDGRDQSITWTDVFDFLREKKQFIGEMENPFPISTEEIDQIIQKLKLFHWVDHLSQVIQNSNPVDTQTVPGEIDKKNVLHVRSQSDFISSKFNWIKQSFLNNLE